MRRCPDWATRLAGAIEAGDGRAFDWGAWDCCQAAATAVSAMTDGQVRITAPFRYTTRAGATRTMRAYVGLSLSADALLAAVAEKRGDEIGMSVVPPARAQRGDVVLGLAATPWGEMPALAVVDMTGLAALTASAEGGWARIGRPSWLSAWRL